MRAIRARYDPYLQTRHRIEQVKKLLNWFLCFKSCCTIAWFEVVKERGVWFYAHLERLSVPHVVRLALLRDSCLLEGFYVLVLLSVWRKSLMKVCKSSLTVNKGLNISFQSQVKKCYRLAQWEQAVYSKVVWVAVWVLWTCSVPWPWCILHQNSPVVPFKGGGFYCI